MINKKVLVIGSGPIVIGQGAEFDYSGTQACRVLKDEGYSVVLVNSNPATIMTDKAIADVVYSEPLELPFIERIIEIEKPGSILVGMGGQTALNLGIELEKAGLVAKHNLKVLGTSLRNVEIGEDRDLFKELMMKINEPTIESHIANTLEEAKAVAKGIGYPVVVRPAYTLGGSGGGMADNEDQLVEIAVRGLKYSMTQQVLIEKSIKGWKEIEYEMMRDAKGNAIAVCNMENLDPVGIHTGDSIVLAPSQTLSDKEYHMLRTASIKIVNALDIIGGCNVQLALNQSSMDYYIIEVNPRVSRSSSLASKATGYPIAKVATKIALGYALDEIENEITKKTFACFEPALDYCVVKIPKWPFDKFDYADKHLGTAMKATGEVMAIGNNVEMALLKAVRSLEINQYNLAFKPAREMLLDELFQRITLGDTERLFYIAELFRRQVSLEKVNALTAIDSFYLSKIKNIVMMEESIRNRIVDYVDPEWIRTLKKKGFSDKGMAELMVATTEKMVHDFRVAHGILPAYKMVDTCAAEFEAASPYYYSSFDLEDEVVQTQGKKVLVVGSGPIRIGQGVEFDYCSVHGILALKEEGIEGIIINNNPETVSTDFDISDKLYFEPITTEDVMNIVDKEGIDGVILQFGGQTAIKLAEDLSERGVTILGTSFDSLDATEDRDRFDRILKEHGIKNPRGVGVHSVAEGLAKAGEIGFPMLVRPSYVIGGFGMEIVYHEAELRRYLEAAFRLNPEQSVLIDEFIPGIEVEIDAICDGEEIYIPGIMEHLEEAGVHSGDSIAFYPSLNVKPEMERLLIETTKKLAKAFDLLGIFNVQYIVYEEELYVIEVNPRASRTVPMMSKVTGVPIIELGTKVMLGKKLKDLGYSGDIHPKKDFFAVKNPVFSMEKLTQAEIALGPEMKSTGETMAIDYSLDRALFKGIIASNMSVPKVGKALISISDPKKTESIKILESMKALGFEFYFTAGTYEFARKNGIEGHLIDAKAAHSALIDRKFDLVLNLPTRGKDRVKEGFILRRLSVEQKVPCLTSLSTMALVLKMMAWGNRTEDFVMVDICKIK
ncbi:MAG: carbamoyl phosphate synthase large subunit [delta proteobacterium ML8_F1]|nr:MAG: carbamoyl phosphate synthase large subunit [delta proteobacterium ML8_F1]